MRPLLIARNSLGTLRGRTCLDECSNHLHDAICDPCDPAEFGQGPGAHAQSTSSHGQHDPSHVPPTSSSGRGWFDWLSSFGSSQPHEPHKWPAAAAAHGLQSHPLGGAAAAQGRPIGAWHSGAGAGAHADGPDAHAGTGAAAPVSSYTRMACPFKSSASVAALRQPLLTELTRHSFTASLIGQWASTTQ